MHFLQGALIQTIIQVAPSKSSSEKSSVSAYWQGNVIQRTFIPPLSSSVIPWKNPIFKATLPLPCKIASENRPSSSISLTKQDLQDLEVIGQVGSKFIACKWKQDTLVMVDQHACDVNDRLSNQRKESNWKHI